MEYIELGSSPTEEDCIQVNNSKDYLPEMREELLKYKALLEKRFPFYSDFGYFSILWEYHEFGKYGSIIFRFRESEDNWNAAGFIEDHLPEVWNDSSIYSLEDIKKYSDEKLDKYTF